MCIFLFLVKQENTLNTREFITNPYKYQYQTRKKNTVTRKAICKNIRATTLTQNFPSNLPRKPKTNVFFFLYQIIVKWTLVFPRRFGHNLSRKAPKSKVKTHGHGLKLLLHAGEHPMLAFSKNYSRVLLNPPKNAQVVNPQPHIM